MKVRNWLIRKQFYDESKNLRLFYSIGQYYSVQSFEYPNQQQRYEDYAKTDEKQTNYRLLQSFHQWDKEYRRQKIG